ncbi:MAG TPA: PAS domain-containing protein [Aliiroseovarius sp.]|nr:PAS domain-containing protein [Aliiroseovarius sp.]
MNLETLTGSNIISLVPRRNQAHFPALAQVEAYWEALRNTRPMPTREEVDPRGLTDALSYAFVLERIAPGLAKIRVAGQHLSDLMGMEVRGMPISAMFLPEARQTLRDHLEACFATPATLRLTLAADTGFTRPALEAQLFMAPLKDRDGRPTRILGALQSSGKIGRAPRRFTIRSVKVNALAGEVGAPDAPLAVPQRPAPGKRPAAPEPAKPGLRLVYSAED